MQELLEQFKKTLHKLSKVNGEIKNTTPTEINNQGVSSV